MEVLGSLQNIILGFVVFCLIVSGAAVVFLAIAWLVQIAIGWILKYIFKMVGFDS